MHNGVYKVYSVPVMLIAFQTHTEYNKKLNKVAHTSFVNSERNVYITYNKTYLKSYSIIKKKLVSCFTNIPPEKNSEGFDGGGGDGDHDDIMILVNM